MSRPVIDQLINNSDHAKFTGFSNLNVVVIPLGEPAKTLFADPKYSKVVYTLPQLGVNTTVIDGDKGRNQTLPSSDITNLLSSLHSKFGNTMVAASGMVYAMQGQIAGALKWTESYVVGLDDSFGLWDNSSIPALDFVANAHVSEIFVTADEVKTQVMNAPHAGSTPLVATVVGSPTLDEWADIAADHSTELVVRQFAFGNDVAESDICVVYAGGYGGDDYIASLKVFCQAVQRLSTNPTQSHEHPKQGQGNRYRFAFSPHPGYSPNYEHGLFVSWGCGNMITILETSMNISTGQAVAASNASLSQCSTVGGQSISIQVPHAFVDAVAPHCEDVFSVTGLIPSAQNTTALTSTINVTFRAEDFRVNPLALELAGVPRNGTTIALHRLLHLANDTTKG